MEIRLAQLPDLKDIKTLTEACAVAMQEVNIFQWNEHYPSLDRLKEDIGRGELYLLEEKMEIVGIIVITQQMDEEYLPIDWITQGEKNLYVHRLATHPTVWGKGYGQKLMDFAEDYARSNGFESVRLDTFSQNKRNHHFYETRGYQKLGDIFFPKQSKEPFHCYELVF